jgi:hypothetical protein
MQGTGSMHGACGVQSGWHAKWHWWPQASTSLQGSVQPPTGASAAKSEGFCSSTSRPCLWQRAGKPCTIGMCCSTVPHADLQSCMLPVRVYFNSLNVIAAPCPKFTVCSCPDCMPLYWSRQWELPKRMRPSCARDSSTFTRAGSASHPILHAALLRTSDARIMRASSP